MTLCLRCLRLWQKRDLYLTPQQRRREYIARGELKKPVSKKSRMKRYGNFDENGSINCESCGKPIISAEDLVVNDFHSYGCGAVCDLCIKENGSLSSKKVYHRGTVVNRKRLVRGFEINESRERKAMEKLY